MLKKITALKVQKRNPNRVNVYINDEFAFGLSRMVAGWLEIGQVLSDEKVAGLKEKDSEQIVYQKALRLLSYRSRSEKEIVDKLRKADCEEEKISIAVKRLRDNDLLNDQNFANTWVENRAYFRPRSRRLLSYELKNKGVDQENIEEALENVESDDELAFRAGEKYVHRLDGFEKAEFTKKMSAYLARKGFFYETVKNTVETIWEEMNLVKDEKIEFENEDLNNVY